MTATSHTTHAVAYTAVKRALQVNAASPMITAPTRRLSVTFVIPAASAATVRTVVAIGGRQALAASPAAAVGRYM